jgi:hypothetical protein
MRKRDISNTSQVPPTPEEFKAIMAGRMNISAALNEFWRQCTDDELATWFRDPAQYSYVLGLLTERSLPTERPANVTSVRIPRSAENYVEENAMIVIGEGVNVPSFATYEEAVASDFVLDHRWDGACLASGASCCGRQTGEDKAALATERDDVGSHEVSAGNNSKNLTTCSPRLPDSELSD